MYDYRKLTPAQRHEIVEYRRSQERPWHSPPHWQFDGQRQFIISAACFDHAPVIGKSLERMTDFESWLLELCEKFSSDLYAWCLLPNHYHMLLKTDRVKDLRREIGKVHGRSSFQWNGEDNARGRQVWHNCFDREIKSHRHFWASVNYIHNNPVKHGYAINGRTGRGRPRPSFWSE